MDSLGAVDSSFGVIMLTYRLLLNLRDSWAYSKDVTTKLDELINLTQRIEQVFESIKAEVKSCSGDENRSIASGLIDIFEGKVSQNIKNAKTALEKLSKYQGSSSGSSSRVGRLRNQVRISRLGLAMRMALTSAIPDALDEAKSCLDKALQDSLSIDIRRKLEVISPSQPERERFIPHFDCPEIPDNVVLDFCSNETQEGRLLRKLLELREKENAQGMSAVGRGSAAHGMGGVGKTTALRAVCYQAKVKQAFPDGICYLEFGQDAKDSDVQDQLERCVENFGGMGILAKMEKQSSLKGVVSQAARWLRQKIVLLVCDDLWLSSASDFGYLPLLKQLLRYAPRGKLLISTRDKRIAEEVSMSYETFGTLPSHGPSARNLLGQMAFGEEHYELLKRPDVQNYFETILKVCAGLQLALCMAGRALRTERERLGDIRKVLEVYTSQLEYDQRPHETARSAQLYDQGLPYIVEASLVQCEQWAKKSLKKANVRDFFLALCVLEKQMVMPKSVLSYLWGLNSRETDHVVQKFADLGLITKTVEKTLPELTQNETKEDYGVRLHDLVLVLCQEMVGDEQEERHGRVIDALKRSQSVWIGEETPALGEWWRLKNSHYIYENLSRHLVNSGRRQALANLLSDVRWTLRRVEIGGWVALKMDFELLLEERRYAEFADVRKVYEILEGHWSAISKEERFLSYYIGGSLSAEERKNKYTALYIDSMMRYLSRPFLVPRSKFLGRQEVSLLTCLSKRNFMLMDFSRSTDIAVVGILNQISVWSVSAQEQLCSFSLRSLPENSVLICLEVSANGRLIVSGHSDGTYRLWDADSGEQVGDEVQAHRDSLTCVVISKDGSTIVTGSKDKTSRLWNARNSKPIGTPMNHENEVTCVVICESGSMVVSGSMDGTVRRWNTETSAIVGEPMCAHESMVRCLAVNENGEMIVSGSADKTLVRWDAKTGNQIGEPMRGHSGSVQCVAISPCGKMIVSGCWFHTLRMWDASNGKTIGEPFRGHFGDVKFVGFTEESGIFVSGSSDGTIRRWRMAHNTQLSESIQRCEGRVTNIAFTDYGKKVVTSSTSGALLQWDVNNGKTVGKQMNASHDGKIRIATNDKCGMILSVRSFEDTTHSSKNGIKNEVVRWDTSTCEMVGEPISVKLKSYVSCAAVSQNGKMIVTGSRDGTVQRYCAVSGNVIGESMRGHKKKVTSAAFTANNEMIVTASDDKSIIRWTAANGKQIGTPISLNGSIRCFCISVDGTVIVSCTNRDGLFSWDLLTGRLIGESVYKKWQPSRIWMSNDGTKILTWAQNKPITWASVEPGGTIRKTSVLRLSFDVTDCAIDMNQGVAAVGLWSGAVAVCDIHR